MITVREVASLTGKTANQVKTKAQNLKLELKKAENRKTAPLNFSHTDLRRYLQSEGYVVKGPKVMVIASEKGGVGKTFLTINTAALATKKGQKVCLIDLDPESCATNSLINENFEINFNYPTILEVFSQNKNLIDIVIPSKYEGLDFIPCKPKARDVERLTFDKHPMELMPRKVEALKAHYDLILLDVPPTFTRLIGSAYLSADVVVQPCLPNIYSIESVELTNTDIMSLAKEFRIEKKELPQIFVLKNKFKTNEVASREANTEINERFSSKVLPFYISSFTDCDKLTNDGLTVIDVKSNASNQIAELYSYFFNIVQPAELS